MQSQACLSPGHFWGRSEFVHTVHSANDLSLCPTRPQPRGRCIYGGHVASNTGVSPDGTNSYPTRTQRVNLPRTQHVNLPHQSSDSTEARYARKWGTCKPSHNWVILERTLHWPGNSFMYFGCEKVGNARDARMS